MEFKLHAPYEPTGDQPQAIEKLVKGFKEGNQFETLLGVTGSGKTFTMANVIQALNKPTLIISHNKTLAGQLYGEMKEFFPENAVEYFVSYYDYYQPEAYVPQSDTYIAKDSAVNDEIDKLRLSATAALAERKDVIIVASVSCIYGIGSPDDYMNMMVSLRPGMEIDRDDVIKGLIDMQYTRNEMDFKRGTFRVHGDVLEIFPANNTDTAPEDIHVYSIDEVFMDVTHYLKTYGMTAYQLAQTIILDVQDHIGITATAGIGTNLYLCKIAMDIVAKHIDADENGVRIAQLDEKSYRKLLWDYRPITDFWRVGPGYAKKLAENGMYTMGDVARCSIGKETDYYNEDLLYKLFGVNAELLIDHAWGYEPCTIAQIKAYRPQANSSGSGQVLQCPYPADKARIVVQEMTDQLVLDLVEHGFVTDQIVLTVGYDIENLTDPVRAKRYHGEVATDRYGRKIPKHAHGTANLQNHTSSAITVVEKTLELYDRIINPDLLIRRIYVTACHVRTEQEAQKEQIYEQMSLFDFAEETEEQKAQKQALQKEKQMQKAMLSIKQRYGKNAILKGTNFKEGATMRQRNGQIGGHRA